MIFRNQKGAILTEWLIAIILFIFIIQLAFPLFQLMNGNKNELSPLLFFYHQLEIELQQATGIGWDHQSIFFSDTNNRRISISTYGSHIRKQVNYQGHEILLRDIEHFRVSGREDSHLKVIITLRNGDSLEKYIEITP